MSKVKDIRIEDFLEQSEEKDDQEPKSEAQKPKLEVPKPETSSEKELKRPKKFLKIVLIILSITILTGLVVWGSYSYIEIEKMRDPAYFQQLEQEENKALLDKVSNHIEIPDTQVIVATITDKTMLKDQLFFENAENGDKVLMFSDSSMTIIYRESTDKIINSGLFEITTTEK